MLKKQLHNTTIFRKNNIGKIQSIFLMRLFHERKNLISKWQFIRTIRCGHGRMIWNEKGRPGYGLYDRALGAAYIAGILESLERG